MTTQEFIQTVVYPALATLITTGVACAVMYLRAMMATQRQVADAGLLQHALERGTALAKASAGQDAPPADLAVKTLEYLHATAPELALRTGMATAVADGTIAPTDAGVKRIDATIASLAAAPSPPEGPKPW